jgi:hypothetical protein
MSNDFVPSLNPINLGPDWELKLDHYLNADYDDIAVACEELPPVIEWINEQLQGLSEDKYIKKQEIKAVEAEVYFNLLNGGYVEKYGGKVTDARLTHAVALDPKVKRAHEKYAVLLGWCQRLNGTLATFQCKLDLVRSSEATRRETFKKSDRDQDPD